MKYIKKFENDILYQVGDIVKIIPDDNWLEEIKKFLNNNIGIIYSKELGDYDYFYNVKYDDVPTDLLLYTRFMGSNPPIGLKHQGEIFTAYIKNLKFPTNIEMEKYNMIQKGKKYNVI
jgi:hypothetical protein